MKLLAISGSLRAQSSNRLLLEAAARLAAPAEVTFYDGLGELPHFNPDLDGEGADAPPAVCRLRELATTADALLISSPEYAHGVPGAMKNALDWLVSTTALSDKPIALLNASPRSQFAHPQLAETLRTMAANVVPEANVAVPLSGRKLDVDAVVADPDLSATLRAALAALSSP